MNKKTQLSQKWLKASIIGTVWASSEIVLGSFLHNLKVPFAGSILTAIGVIILIAASYLWKEKGIFWRAGLICALMKTMSPSAVIFGPMIAIFTEAVLLEITVRVLGRNYTGYIAGSVLAVSWGFFQKIMSLLILYGFNIVELYKNLMQFTANQLNLEFDVLWFPLLIFLSVYILIGLFAAITGIKTGEKLISRPMEYSRQKYNNQYLLKSGDADNGVRYSVPWLVFNLLLVVASLLLISLTHWKIWSIFIFFIVITWIIKYKRALRQLSRPGFWLIFAGITMLTAFLFTRFQAKPVEEALLTGLEMNFRATVLILGFSVIGTELYNPRIRAFFSKTAFRQLPVALELSAESLPHVIANIPDVRTILKSPVSVVYHLIAFSDFRLSQMKNEHLKNPQVFVLQGKKDGGKTTFVKKLIATLHEKGMKPGGFYSQKIYENNRRTGYDLVEIKNQKSEPFLSINHWENAEKVGIFSLSPTALQTGNKCLDPENNRGNQIVIIDEVGFWELEGKGWAKSIEKLLETGKNHLVFAVREGLAEKVIQKWNLKNSKIFDIHRQARESIEKEILEEIKQTTGEFSTD